MVEIIQTDVDELMGRQLAHTGHLYFHQIDTENATLAKQMGIKLVRKPSVAIAQYGIEVSYLFDMAPLEITGSNIHIDLDRDAYAPIPKDGDRTKSSAFTMVSGFYGSLYEEIVLEQMFQAKSASALRIISNAGNSGMPIYLINKDNINAILPKINLMDPPAGAGDIASYKINAQEKAELKNISNLVAAGNVVVVPENISTMEAFAGNAYLVLDPKTGSGTFMITGGYAGGTITEDIQAFLRQYSTSSGTTWVKLGGDNDTNASLIVLDGDKLRAGDEDPLNMLPKLSMVSPK